MKRNWIAVASLAAVLATAAWWLQAQETVGDASKLADALLRYPAGG
jgi:hypothetical protein